MEANKLTTKSQEALSAAVRHSVDRGNPAVEPAHLLGALLAQTDGTAGPLLRAVGADLTDVRAENDALQGRLPSASGATVSAPEFSRDLHKVMTAAVKQAEELSDEYLSTEHLLVGLAAEGGPVAELLRRHGATPDALLTAFQQVRGSSRVTSPDPEGTYQALEKYGVDLTASARDGKLDPVIGRDNEIRRVVQVLSRRTKNNPVLIGEPGRRQDRGRRGPGPADRGRRRAGVAAGQAAGRARPRRDGRRREVPRRVRGAAQGRPRRDQGVRRPGRHVHRRAAHGRRGRARRGRRDGRGQHAQADAGPRRAADGRRHHPGRVPGADREGPRPGAPVPAGAGRRALGRGHDRDPARPEGPVRGAPPGADRRLRAGRRRDAVRPLHHRPVPAGQGDRPGRRVRVPAADGDRLPAGGDRRAAAGGRPAEDGGAGPRARDRRGRQGAAGAAAPRPGRPAGAAVRADRPLGAGEDRAQPGRRAEEAARRPARAGRAGAARG